MEASLDHGVKRTAPEEKFTPCKKSRYENIEVLPDELILTVFSQLPFKDILTASLVCKRWKEIANDDYLWSQIFCRFFNRSHDDSLIESPKLQFQNVLMEEIKLITEYPEWIINAFGSARAIADLPIVNIPIEKKISKIDWMCRNLLDHHMFEISKSMISPIMRIKFDFGGRGQSALIIRYMKTSSSVKKCDLIIFNGNDDWWFHNYSEKRNDLFISYFSRLIRREPCGELIGFRLIPSNIFGEVNRPSDGSSLVYLA